MSVYHCSTQLNIFLFQWGFSSCLFFSSTSGRYVITKLIKVLYNWPRANLCPQGLVRWIWTKIRHFLVTLTSYHAADKAYNKIWNIQTNTSDQYLCKYSCTKEMGSILWGEMCKIKCVTFQLFALFWFSIERIGVKWPPSECNVQLFLYISIVKADETLFETVSETFSVLLQCPPSEGWKIKDERWTSFF